MHSLLDWTGSEAKTPDDTVGLAVATATRMAPRHFDQALPCPVCADVLKASNLDRHLGKVHPDVRRGRMNVGVIAAWVGKDRASLRLVLFLFAAMAFSIPAASVLGTWVLWILGPLDAAALAVLFLVIADRLLARLEWTPDGLRLRYGFGLVNRTLEAVERIEVGSLRDSRSSAILSSYSTRLPDNVGHQRVSAGWYIRLIGRGGAITVGCPKGTGFRQRWDAHGWSAASTRRVWDITLDRAAMVALEYRLVELGLLKPAPAPGPRA